MHHDRPDAVPAMRVFGAIACAPAMAIDGSQPEGSAGSPRGNPAFLAGHNGKEQHR
jgi:hypothetical protein